MSKSRRDPEGMILRGADLTGAVLAFAELSGVDFRGATMREAVFCGANLAGANLRGLNLTRIDFEGANLSFAKLDSALLHKTRLAFARMTGTSFRGCTIHECGIFGVSAWELDLEGADQRDLVVTNKARQQPTITVDTLEVGQLIYLLLSGQKIGEVIEEFSSRVVLILGRFSPKRKRILDAIRERLKDHGYIAVLFDFKKPTTRSLTETIVTLAHLSRFVIADITAPRGVPQELQAIVPNLPHVPIQPILAASEYEYGMFDGLRAYPWVRPVFRYRDLNDLLGAFSQLVKGVDKGAAQHNKGDRSISAASAGTS